MLFLFFTLVFSSSLRQSIGGSKRQKPERSGDTSPPQGGSQTRPLEQRSAEPKTARPQSIKAVTSRERLVMALHAICRLARVFVCLRTSKVAFYGHEQRYFSYPGYIMNCTVNTNVSKIRVLHLAVSSMERDLQWNTRGQ